MRLLPATVLILLAAIALPGSSRPGSECEDVVTTDDVSLGADADCTFRHPDGAEYRCDVYINTYPVGWYGCLLS